MTGSLEVRNKFLLALCVFLALALATLAILSIRQATRLSDLEGALSNTQQELYQQGFRGLQRDYFTLCLTNNGSTREQACQAAAEYAAGGEVTDPPVTDADKRYLAAKKLIGAKP